MYPEGCYVLVAKEPIVGYQLNKDDISLLCEAVLNTGTDTEAKLLARIAALRSALIAISGDDIEQTYIAYWLSLDPFNVAETIANDTAIARAALAEDDQKENK